jgi:hypothetical protein
VLHRPGVLAILPGELARHRLQQIVHGDETLLHAVLADDVHELRTRRLEMVEQIQADQAFGYGRTGGGRRTLSWHSSTPAWQIAVRKQTKATRRGQLGQSTPSI